jgi:RNA polymerase sigma factor (sigma-70 family)
VFPLTPRSILEDLRSESTERKARARARLAEQYWSPIYAYLRFRWRLEKERAAELTQDLFLRDLEKSTFSKFDPERSRFRTYLRTCADNLVRDEVRYHAAEKRGSAEAMVNLEDAERELAALDGSLSPEDAFDQAWRGKVLAIARVRLEESLTRRGKALHAQIFTLFHGDDPPPSYADVAARFEISVSDVTNWLHLARREWRTQFALVLQEGGINAEDLALELQRSG